MLLPVAALAEILLVQASGVRRAAALGAMEHRTELLASRLDGRLELAFGALRTLASGEAAQREDLAGLHEQARRAVALDRERGFLAATAVDRDQQVRFLTAVPYGAVPFPANYPHLVREALATGRPNVSGPFAFPMRPITVVAATVPMIVEGVPKYGLRMILSTESLDRLLDADALPGGWVATLADRIGTAVARSADSVHHVARRVARAQYQAMLVAPSRPLSVSSESGQASTTILRPVHGGDWWVLLEAPDDAVFEPAGRDALRLAGVAVAWLTLASLLASLSRRFVLPRP